ncbi:TPA: hypothetical protein ACH3X1_014272 [Trebouxia sp. C0004]
MYLASQSSPGRGSEPPLNRLVTLSVTYSHDKSLQPPVHRHAIAAVGRYAGHWTERARHAVLLGAVPSPLGPDKLLCCVDLKLVAQERYEGWHPEKELFLDATAHGDAFLEKTKPLFAGKALRPALIDLEQQMCPSLQISLQKNQVHHQRKQCSGRQPI